MYSFLSDTRSGVDTILAWLPVVFTRGFPYAIHSQYLRLARLWQHMQPQSNNQRVWRVAFWVRDGFSPCEISIPTDQDQRMKGRRWEIWVYCGAKMKESWRRKRNDEFLKMGKTCGRWQEQWKNSCWLMIEPLDPHSAYFAWKGALWKSPSWIGCLQNPGNSITILSIPYKE